MPDNTILKYFLQKSIFYLIKIIGSNQCYKCKNNERCRSGIPQVLEHKYIPSLILFIIDNPNNFQRGLEMHGQYTRSKINFSFQLQNSQVFKKELPILILKYVIVCPAIV